MKIRNRINILLSCMVVLTMGLVSACDDTVGGETTTELGFPTDTLFADVVPGDTVPVSFNVDYNWKLNSDKDWCRVNGEDISFGGKAGAHTVDFVISDRGNLFSADEALITLHMNNESRVIACITRRASMEYDVEVSNNGKVVADRESIVIGDSGRVVLDLDSNFKMDMLGLDAPGWVRLERREKCLVLNVVEDSLKYTINREEDSLRLFKDSTFYCSFHVQYIGMNPRELRIEGQLKSTLIVSQDAKRTYMNGEVQNMPIDFTVTSLNDDYEIISIGYGRDKGCYMLDVQDEWFVVQDDYSGNVSLSVTGENDGNERIVHLLALPQVLVDSLGNSDELLGYLSEEIEGKLELTEQATQYRLVKVQQDGLNFIKINPETRWNLKVTVDGKTYYDAIMGSETYKAPMKATIESSRGYELICANYDGKYTLTTVEDSWLNVEDDKQGNVQVYFDENNEGERTLFLFALPLTLIEGLEPDTESFLANLSSTLFADDSLLEEQYVVAKLVQEPNPDNSMKVLRGGQDPIEVVAETDKMWLDSAAVKGVAADKVFRCSLKLGYSYQVNPLIHMSVWEPTLAKPETGEEDLRDKIEIYGKSGKKYESGVDYKEEPMLLDDTEGEYYLVQLSQMRSKIQEDFIIYFINDGVEYMKALVVTIL